MSEQDARCPYCSFHPVSDSDFCAKHRESTPSSGEADMHCAVCGQDFLRPGQTESPRWVTLESKHVCEECWKHEIARLEREGPMRSGHCMHCDRYTDRFYSNAHLGGNGYFDCGCKDRKDVTPESKKPPQQKKKRRAGR